MALPRFLHPAANPAGYTSAAGVIYAAAVMLWNARYHHDPVSAPVIVAAIAAIASLVTRQLVTPVADPRDATGTPLRPQPVLVSPRARSKPRPTGAVRLVPGPDEPAPGGPAPEVTR
jgi:hypothetical protein